MSKPNKYGSPGLFRFPQSSIYHVEVRIPLGVRQHPDLVNSKGNPQRFLRVSLGTDSLRRAHSLAPQVVSTLKHRIQVAAQQTTPALSMAQRYQKKLKEATTVREQGAILVRWEHALRRMVPRVEPKGSTSFTAYQVHTKKIEMTKLVKGEPVNAETLYGPQKTTATDHYLEDFIAWSGSKMSGGNAHKVRVSIARIKSAFPALSMISKAKLSKYWSTLMVPTDDSKALAHATVSYMRGHGTKYWEYLAAHDYVDAEAVNPFSASALPPAPDKSDTQYSAFSQDEAASLYGYALHKVEGKNKDAGDLALVILLGAYSGVRLGAIANSKIEHFNLDVGTWIIPSDKTKAGKRMVPLHPALLPALRRWVGNKSSGPMFEASSTALGKRFERIRDNLGLEPHKKVFHSWRHTAVNILKSNHVPEPDAAALMGHSTATSTYSMYGSTTIADATGFRHHLAHLVYEFPLGGPDMELPAVPKIGDEL